MNGQKLIFIAAEPMIAPEKGRMRNTEKSNIGLELSFSAIRKAMKLAAEAPRIRSAAGLAKPSSGPCVMKKARQKTDSESVAMPAISRRAASGSRDSLTPPEASSHVTMASAT